MSAPDVVVIGAGIVGAACGYYAARAGLSVIVVDRAGPASGTSGAGEGNILVSDKLPGHDLELALLSARLWRELAAEIVPSGAPDGPAGREPGFQPGFEYEPKGGLVVAQTQREQTALEQLAQAQHAQGLVATTVAGEDLGDLEPYLTPGLAGGVHYPQDAQVQPMLATAYLLRAARPYGLTLRTGTEVTGLLRARRGPGRRGPGRHGPAERASKAVSGTGSGAAAEAAGDAGHAAADAGVDVGERVVGVRTGQGDIFAGAVVNATGAWGREVAAMAGRRLRVAPRRGFVLVTEPLPTNVIRHKVYTAAYADTIASDSSGLETAAVVEGTPSGPVLIGSSRERVGFDRTLSLPVLRALAVQAISLFPALADVSVIRAYCGFRPDSPDRMPMLGPDPRVPGLLHACGHEGAGICLAPATGHLIAQCLTGQPPDVDLAPFRPDRFDGDADRADATDQP